MKSKLAEIYCLTRISSLNEHDPICTQSYLRVCRNLPEGTFQGVTMADCNANCSETRGFPHFCKMGPTMQSGWIVGGLALLFAVIGSVESSCTVTPAKVETTCKLA